METTVDENGRKMYIKVCCDCCSRFETYATNTCFCKECIKVHKAWSSKKAYAKKKLRLEKERLALKKKCEIQFGEEKCVDVPKEYLERAEIMTMSDMGMSYGKFQTWKNEHPKEWKKWEKVLAKKYEDAPNTPNGQKVLVFPTKESFLAAQEIKVEKKPTHEWAAISSPHKISG